MSSFVLIQGNVCAQCCCRTLAHNERPTSQRKEYCPTYGDLQPASFPKSKLIASSTESEGRFGLGKFLEPMKQCDLNGLKHFSAIFLYQCVRNPGSEFTVPGFTLPVETGKVKTGAARTLFKARITVPPTQCKHSGTKGQVSLICAQRHMNSIEASTQTYITRFIGRICFVAVTGQRAGCAGRLIAVCFLLSNISFPFAAFAHLATALGRCDDSHLHFLTEVFSSMTDGHSNCRLLMLPEVILLHRDLSNNGRK